MPPRSCPILSFLPRSEEKEIHLLLIFTIYGLTDQPTDQLREVIITYRSLQKSINGINNIACTKLSKRNETKHYSQQNVAQIIKTTNSKSARGKRNPCFPLFKRKRNLTLGKQKQTNKQKDKQMLNSFKVVLSKAYF